MTQEAFNRGDWQAVLDSHRLESHDPAEWLRYGSALLHSLEPGPEAGKQQQQAALAFEQARKERATAEEVKSAQRQAVMLSLREALKLVGIAIPAPFRESFIRRSEPGTNQSGFAASAEKTGHNSLSTLTAENGQTGQKDPLRALVAAMAAGFNLQISAEVSLLDQLLAAKQQLNDQHVSAVAVEEMLRQDFSLAEQAWADALVKVQLVLRLPGA
jgi:hypothetical protein